jgi:hypothetical protein
MGFIYRVQDNVKSNCGIFCSPYSVDFGVEGLELTSIQFLGSQCMGVYFSASVHLHGLNFVPI